MQNTWHCVSHVEHLALCICTQQHRRVFGQRQELLWQIEAWLDCAGENTWVRLNMYTQGFCEKHIITPEYLTIINPRHVCAARVMVFGLCVCLCVCLCFSVTGFSVTSTRTIKL